MVDINECIIKPLITRDVIRDNILDESIYTYYMNTHKIKIGSVMSSPFRDDKTPSFGFFESKEGYIIYNDFVKGGGDCFKFVKELFQYTRWYDVYSRIAIDFGLHKRFKCNEDLDSDSNKKVKQRKRKIKISRKEKCEIQVNRRSWEKHDIDYWSKFNIDLKILKDYNVSPIKYIFLNKKPIAADKHAYVYTEWKDSVQTLKIYQPYSEYKWFTNSDNSVWQGWTQLPKSGSKLIITKSLKDVMSIINTTGIPAISLQNEKAKPKDNIIDQLKLRFDNIFVFFDNDYDKEENWGQLSAQEICKEYSLRNVCLSEVYKSKDFSELVDNYDKNLAKTILNSKTNI